ncbi:MAG: hypothetical protein HZC04_02220 [Candidatus Lloydbacteria bacterium]|nr:hypothetical protein [Candidatus Lloydbacteria bacterium]
MAKLTESAVAEIAVASKVVIVVAEDLTRLLGASADLAVVEIVLSRVDLVAMVEVAQADSVD